MVDMSLRQFNSGGDRVSRTMGGGWARSVGGLPQRWMTLRRLICSSHDAAVFSTYRPAGVRHLDGSYAQGYEPRNTIQGRHRPMLCDPLLSNDPF